MNLCQITTEFDWIGKDFAPTTEDLGRIFVQSWYLLCYPKLCMIIWFVYYLYLTLRLHFILCIKHCFSFCCGLQNSSVTHQFIENVFGAFKVCTLVRGLVMCFLSPGDLRHLVAVQYSFSWSRWCIEREVRNKLNFHGVTACLLV